MKNKNQHLVDIIVATGLHHTVEGDQIEGICGSITPNKSGGHNSLSLTMSAQVFKSNPSELLDRAQECADASGMPVQIKRYRVAETLKILFPGEEDTEQ